MYKANFSNTEKRFITRAAELEIDYLKLIYESKESQRRIKSQLSDSIKDKGLEISCQIVDLVEDFTKLKEDPNILYTLPEEHLEIICLILVEHFEEEWESETEDDVEFAALCYKILNFTELRNQNNSNLN